VRESRTTRRHNQQVGLTCNLLVRTILMKPTVIGLAISAMLTAAAPTAFASLAVPASAVQSHRCAPSQPSFTSLMATPAVSCREARALNTYMTRHETLSGRFTLNGETWLGTVSSRAQNETEMVYHDGDQTVWITYAGPAS
jgi:hypothetical protein